MRTLTDRGSRTPPNWSGQPNAPQLVGAAKRTLIGRGNDDNDMLRWCLSWAWALSKDIIEVYLPGILDRRSEYVDCAIFQKKNYESFSILRNDESQDAYRAKGSFHTIL